jgi:hypothetical protein
MRRYALTPVTLVAVASLALLVTGCGGGSDATTEAQTTTDSESYTNENWAIVVSDPDSYKGATVQLVGRVFEVERDEDGVGMQVWMDARNSDQNTIVGYKDPSFQVASDDYVRVTGTVGEQFEGENAFGAKLTVPTVIADSVEIVDAIATALPAHTTYAAASSIQGQIRMTVTKIEAAPDETRVYVALRNQSSSDFSFYGSSGKLVANGRSIKSSYSGDYPEPASDIPTNSRTTGVILFEKIPPNAALRLILEGYSENSDVGNYGSLTWTFAWK